MAPVHGASGVKWDATASNPRDEAVAAPWTSRGLKWGRMGLKWGRDRPVAFRVIEVGAAGPVWTEDKGNSWTGDMGNSWTGDMGNRWKGVVAEED
jgi:hypothetical protein